MNETERDLTCEEAGKLLGLSAISVQVYAAKGRISGYKLGRDWRIPRDAIVAYQRRDKPKRGRPPKKGKANERSY